MLLFLANKKHWYFNDKTEDDIVKHDKSLISSLTTTTPTGLQKVLPVAVTAASR